VANTYIDFSVDDIDKTSKDDYKIKYVPRITEVILSNTGGINIKRGMVITATNQNIDKSKRRHQNGDRQNGDMPACK